MSLLEHLPHTATAKRRTRTVDSLGGSKDSFPTTLFADRACWKQPLSSSELIKFQKRGIAATHKVYFAVDPELTERDQLTIDGEDWTVKSVSSPDASAGLGVLWRIEVEPAAGGLL